jgi:alpha-tubulin suppressor-like RCC1 family protein
MNTTGQLAIGSLRTDKRIYKINTVEVIGRRIIRDICCGGYHSLLVTEDNQLYSVGNNSFGQLCLNHNITRPFFQSMKKFYPQGTIQVVDCGGFHTAVIINNDLLLSGHNDRGQLCMGDKKRRKILEYVSNVKATHVSLGLYHTAVVTIGIICNT